MPDQPVVRIALDDTLQTTVSWSPENSDSLEALENWKEGMMEKLQSHPVWSDSLVLKPGPGNTSVTLSLASGKPREAWLGKNIEIKFLFGNNAARPDSQAVSNDACARALLSGGRCVEPVPKGRHWINAILRGAAPDSTLLAAARSGKACLEGRFELTANWLQTASPSLR